MKKDNTIKFKFTKKDNNHNKEMKIKEYLNQSEKNKIVGVKENCERHNKKYKVLFCLL